MCMCFFFQTIRFLTQKPCTYTVPNLDLKYQLHILDLAWLIKIYFQKMFIETRYSLTLFFDLENRRPNCQTQV